MSATVVCPVCDGERWDPLHTKLGHTYVVCAGCGTGRLDPLPSADAAADLYGEGYFEAGSNGGYGDYDADEALHRRNARDRLAFVRERVAAPQRLLDVGCASGWFLEEARAAGLGVGTGVDVSPWARRRCGGRGFVVGGSLDEPAVVEAAPHGGVTFFQSLEHTVDPLADLRAARALVGTGAPLVVESWDRSSRIARLLGARWQQVTPPSVVWLFDRDGLVRLVEKAGFRAASVRSSSKRVSTGLVLTQVGARLGGLGRPLVRLGAGRLGRVAVPYRLGDLVTLSAVAGEP